MPGTLKNPSDCSEEKLLEYCASEVRWVLHQTFPLREWLARSLMACRSLVSTDANTAVLIKGQVYVFGAIIKVERALQYPQRLTFNEVIINVIELDGQAWSYDQGCDVEWEPFPLPVRDIYNSYYALPVRSDEVVSEADANLIF